ncbi:RNA polymerase sigma factor, sigma-70 family [Paenibacillus sp. UNCCL117]|uniref:sigma-70 family RNA polymerase sigma factor n=1 Tax=unclassified Paenibacillus TaxID=185978 RepID=UPI000887E2E3|nr:MULTISPECIES: sigma-70 family RNA polymerase sigma factor [unclassified Paenibacillus]SDE55620.1 RNA polymerase sigma factor, sigma-70 family [Paenibacillus sp. cl123]SFW66393.1 RNA polymerase sigma factor, sigma-70 family [Paenibacillus sp. UNCCL117]
MRQWIERARLGDQEAYEHIVRHFKGMAHTVAYGKLSDRFLAEDAVQEAFVEAFANLAKLQDPEAFPGWFKTIVEHRCYRFLRRKKQVTFPLGEAVGIPADDSSVESIIETKERQETLIHSVECLPPHLKLAVQLFYLQGYSIKEISSCLGLSASVLKKRLFDARQKLKSSLLVSDFISIFNDLYQGGGTMLHIVNGDHVGNKLKEGNIRGDILVWREIYSVGPVFEKMNGHKERLFRAQYLERTLGVPASDFIKNCESQEQVIRNFHQYEEVVMWFEHDLFDQTMLCYLLDWFAKQSVGTTPINLLCIGDYPGIDLFRGMGQLSSEQLKSLSGTWSRIGEKEFELGSRIWKAYTSPNVEDHIDILQMDTAVLPFARAAFTQHAARLPSPDNGLGIVEQTTLEFVDKGVHTSHKLFQEVGKLLHSLGMGDLEFWYRLRTMSAGPNALLELRTPTASSSDSAVALTELGRAVLSGEKDWLREKEMDEWYGGLHLGKEMNWRWDRTRERLVYT